MSRYLHTSIFVNDMKESIDFYTEKLGLKLLEGPLHYPGNAFPTDVPRPQLNTFNLQKFSNGAVFDNELWGADFGVLR